MQSKHTSSLQAIYSTQSGVGFIVTFLGTLLVAAMSTDSPSISSASAFWSTVFVFTILFIITISLPKAALEELKDYKSGGKLYYNMLDATLMVLLFFPLALWQFYLLFRVSTRENVTKKRRVKVTTDTKSKIDLDKYIEKSFEEIGLALTTY